MIETVTMVLWVLLAAFVFMSVPAMFFAAILGEKAGYAVSVFIRSMFGK